MSTTTTTRRSSLLATMQAQTAAMETEATELDSMLAAYRAHTPARGAATLALHVASMDALTPVQRKRVTAVCEDMTATRVERVAITRDVYVTLTRKGNACYAYRGDIAGGARECIGRFASVEAVSAMFGA